MATPTTEPDFRFRLDGKLVEIKVSELTFAEVDLLEDAFDAPLSEINFERTKALRILAFIALRKKNSKLTLADLDKLKLGAIEPIEDEETEAEDKRPTRPASKAKAAPKAG